MSMTLTCVKDSLPNDRVMVKNSEASHILVVNGKAKSPLGRQPSSPIAGESRLAMARRIPTVQLIEQVR